MRERAASTSEASNGEKLLRSLPAKERRVSCAVEFRNVNFGGKLEKYKILLEKEYELRSRLERASIIDDKRRCVSFCDCGRQIYPTSCGNTSAMLRTRSTSGTSLRMSHQRPLSADNIQPTALDLRKMAAEEKADKRRASIKSLEEDFTKARLFIRRSRDISSSESLNESINESKEDISSINQNKEDINSSNECIKLRELKHSRHSVSTIKERPVSSFI